MQKPNGMVEVGCVHDVLMRIFGDRRVAGQFTFDKRVKF